MPTGTDAPAAPAPAAPASTPNPAPTPPPPAAPPTPPADNRALASKLMKLLVDTKDAGDDTPPPKVEPAPAKTEPAAPPAAPAPTAEERPIKVRKPKTPVETPPPVPKVEPVAPTPAPAAAKVPEQTDEEFEKGLVDEEREQLELARYAESKFPDKYKGLADRTKKFLKEHAAKVSVPDFDETDPEYKTWLKANMPKLSQAEVRKIDEERIADRVSKQHESKYAELRQEIYVRDEEPKIKAEGNRIYNQLANSALPDEVKNAFAAKVKEFGGDTKKAVASVQEEYALEFEISENIINVAVNDIEELTRIATVNPATGKALRAFDPTNPQHERLVQLVSAICNDFKAEGGEALKRGGKWFATREEWINIPADQKKNWWTFEQKELVERAMARVPMAIKLAVKQQNDRLEKLKFKRVVGAPPQAPAPAPTPPQSGAPAAPRPAPVPGASPAAPQSLGALLAQKLQPQ